MAIANLVETPGMTQEQYDAAAQQIAQAGPFRGWLVHVAGPMEGGWRIVDVWESEAAMDAFYRSEVFIRATATLPQATFTSWSVHALENGLGSKDTPVSR